MTVAEAVQLETYHGKGEQKHHGDNGPGELSLQHVIFRTW